MSNTLSLTDTKAELTKARKDYHAAKKDHKGNRLKFMENFKEKDRKQLQAAEAARAKARIVKIALNKLESTSVTKILVDDQWKDTQTDIEEALFPINKGKINASQHAPFLQPHLRRALGDQGYEAAVDEILEGSFALPGGTDKYTRMLLRQARQTHALPPKQSYITTEENTQAWKKAKERTSAGISGLHFGMFKAQATRKHLSALDTSIQSLAHSTGFTYRRWQFGIDVQLLKCSQDYRANKLCTVLLLEADFNMNNKKPGKEAMEIGERLHLLTRDNYGGRKKLRAAEISMNQQLTYDSIRGRRGKAVIISNDAKGCYDRIAHIVAKLALRKLGASRTGLHSMINTIQRLRHYIRTAFGNSEQTYGQEAHELPSQGILQGNGAGPATWSAICTLIVNAMKEEGFGYQQWTLISKRAVTLTCFAFVDDTDLIHAETAHDASTEDLLISAQDTLTTWEGLITSTGGALAPKKSYWCLLDMVRRNGRWGYRHSKQDEDLVLSNNGNPQIITRHRANVANEALGIQTRPDGKMQDERDYLLQKASQWAETVRSKQLSRSEAWYCVQSTIMKTLEYPLVATSLSRSDVDTIMTPILKAILPKLGIQKKIPHSLLY